MCLIYLLPQKQWLIQVHCLNPIFLLCVERLDGWSLKHLPFVNDSLCVTYHLCTSTDSASVTIYTKARFPFVLHLHGAFAQVQQPIPLNGLLYLWEKWGESPRPLFQNATWFFGTAWFHAPKNMLRFLILEGAIKGVVKVEGFLS